MARFEVGDRVTWRGDWDHECTVLAVHDGYLWLAEDGQSVPCSQAAANCTPVPPPDPRDAVVEAAVALVEHHWGAARPISDRNAAIYDAVQAWKAAQ